jgi:hypothetical protein
MEKKACGLLQSKKDKSIVRLKYMVRLRNHGGQGMSFAVEQKGSKALLA